MTNRKKTPDPAPTPAPAGTTISNSTFTVMPPVANEHTRAAVEALAAAAIANAEAISAIARALQGPTTMSAPMINVGAAS